MTDPVRTVPVVFLLGFRKKEKRQDKYISRQWEKKSIATKI